MRGGAVVVSAATFSWSSDHGLLVTFGDGTPSAEIRAAVLSAVDALASAGIPSLRNLHPAYASILAICDPRASAPVAFEASVRSAIASVSQQRGRASRLVEVPVSYGGAHGPDLDEVAKLHGMTAAEVVQLHSSAEYAVAFLGFTPGFPYLEGLPEALATPRLADPRRTTPSGSVAIGGRQCGIYPFSTPGGWRVIGRTALEIFRADRDPPASLMPGDRVRFRSIPADEVGRAGGEQR